MIPVITSADVARIDAAAADPAETLIARAGAAVAAVAIDVLGGAYGRRIVVVVGKGNNGADGRVAADRLARRGAAVDVIEVADVAARLPEADLVIDAAFGTGLRDPWDAPSVGDCPVLAVDLPSGVDPDTGHVAGRPLAADVTVTFAALKPGLLLEPGRSLAGSVHVADIGVDASAADGPAMGLVEAADVARWWRPNEAAAHKWHRAVAVIAGSPGMEGAAWLVARGAQRAGAGMVRVMTRSESPSVAPVEAVTAVLRDGWVDTVADDLRRYGALVVGPGLGRSDTTAAEVQRAVAEAPCPVVVDADGLFALGTSRDAGEIVAGRGQPTIFTPHHGEFLRLFGDPAPGDDPVAAVRNLADKTGAYILAKGPTTMVCAPDGELRFVASGDERLATAGTGDVLAGVCGAALAAGLDPLDAAAAAAWIHGAASSHTAPIGTVAGDVADAVAHVLSGLMVGDRRWP